MHGIGVSILRFLLHDFIGRLCVRLRFLCTIQIAPCFLVDVRPCGIKSAAGPLRGMCFAGLKIFLWLVCLYFIRLGTLAFVQYLLHCLKLRLLCLLPILLLCLREPFFLCIEIPVPKPDRLPDDHVFYAL